MLVGIVRSSAVWLKVMPGTRLELVTRGFSVKKSTGAFVLGSAFGWNSSFLLIIDITLIDVFLITNMAEPTLQQIFGANATQDATTITISKADLFGLTASASNTGESILVSINLTARNYLTEANYVSNIDQSIYIEDGLSSFTTREDTAYRQDQITFNLAKIDTSNAINPDDY